MAPAVNDPPPLMDRLRAASRSAHRSSTVSALAATATVAAAPSAYRHAVVAFATIYAELEATIAAGRMAVPRLGALHCPPLYRSAALAADVAFHWGGGGDDAAAAAAALAAPSSPAVAAYVAYLRSLRAARPPVGLIGVATAMHIAPAAGGSTLARILKRTLRLGGGDGDDGASAGDGGGGGDRGTPGLAVFAYPGVDVPRVRRAYEEGLNALRLSDAEVATVLAARARVFALNDAVFVEVASAAARRGVAATARAVAAVAVVAGSVWWARDALAGSLGVVLGVA